MADWDDMVLVGRIARPHGIRGHVVINPETDFVEQRFRRGATMVTRDASAERTLTVADLRIVGGRPVVGFEGCSRIEDVEGLSGQELRVPEDALQPLERGQFYHHQLVGCLVESTQGTRVGTVDRVEGGIGGSRLVIRTHGTAGEQDEILVPLAEAICVEIDVAARRIRIDPPEGLLDLNEVRHRHDLPTHGRGRARRGDRRTGN